MNGERGSVMARVCVLLVALCALYIASKTQAAPAPFAKSVRPKAEPPFDLLKQEMAEKTGFHVQEVIREGPLWLVKCSGFEGGYTIARFSVRNAANRESALRQLIKLYGRIEKLDKPKN